MFLVTRAYCPDPALMDEFMDMLKLIEGSWEYPPDHPLHLLQSLRTDWKRKMDFVHNYQYWTIFWKHVDRYYFGRST